MKLVLFVCLFNVLAKLKFGRRGRGQCGPGIPAGIFSSPWSVGVRSGADESPELPSQGNYPLPASECPRHVSFSTSSLSVVF